jgi:hypothetical protein
VGEEKCGINHVAHLPLSELSIRMPPELSDGSASFLARIFSDPNHKSHDVICLGLGTFKFGWNSSVLGSKAAMVTEAA